SPLTVYPNHKWNCMTKQASFSARQPGFPGDPAAPRAAGLTSPASGQVFRVERLEFGHDEPAVLADQTVVEPDFAAAVLRPLDQHQIPVDGRAVAVVRFP